VTRTVALTREPKVADTARQATQRPMIFVRVVGARGH